MAEFWASVAQHVAGGSRTDVLRGLIWPNAMLLIGVIWAATHGAPAAVLILLSVLLVSFLLLYGAAFVAFGIKDPNLLRSERFNIERLAIERGVRGDNETGLVEAKAEARLGIEAKPQPRTRKQS